MEQDALKFIIQEDETEKVICSDRKVLLHLQLGKVIVDVGLKIILNFMSVPFVGQVWAHYRYTHVLQDRPIRIQSNIEALSRDHCWRGKAINITCSECVSVALVSQHVKSMHLFNFSSVTCLALPYISALTRNWHEFRGGGGWRGNLLKAKCALVSSTAFILHTSYPKKNLPIYYHKCAQVFM